MKSIPLVVEGKSIKEIINFSNNFIAVDSYLWAITKISCGIYKNKRFEEKSFYYVPLQNAEDFFESCFEDNYKDVKLDIISGSDSDTGYVATIIFTKIKESKKHEGSN